MDEMYHHGILGQKWGVRRFQNKDGTLTAAGQKRLEKKDAKWAHKNHDKKEVMIQNGDVFWFQTETCLECVYW